MLMAFLFLISVTASAQHPKLHKPRKSMVSDCTKMCGSYGADSEPDGAVSSDFIQKMTIAYANDKGKLRVEGTDDSDALSVVFDLEKLKSFIWHIENAACNNGCRGKKMLGVRFYYIKYDTAAVEGRERDLIAANPNKHSLAMVPVYLGPKNDWYDFDYKKVGSGCSFPAPTITNKPEGAGVIAIDGTNHGGLAPPPQPFYYPHVTQ